MGECRVILYGKDGCSLCSSIKETLLKEKEKMVLEFKDVDDPLIYSEFVLDDELSGLDIPVLVVEKNGCRKVFGPNNLNDFWKEYNGDEKESK